MDFGLKSKTIESFMLVKIWDEKIKITHSNVSLQMLHQ